VLQIFFWGIYCQGSRKKLIGNIGEIIGKQKLGKIDNLKNSEILGEIGDIYDTILTD